MNLHAFLEGPRIRLRPLQAGDARALVRAASGAKQEGVVRNERIMPDGRKRNSVRFSIIDEEWPAVRSFLESRL